MYTASQDSSLTSAAYADSPPYTTGVATGLLLNISETSPSAFSAFLEAIDTTLQDVAG